MSIIQKPAVLKPLSNASDRIKEDRKRGPQIEFRHPIGGEDQTLDFQPCQDLQTQNLNSFIEDSRKSNFTFRGLLHLQFCLMILSITSFVAEVLTGEFKDLDLYLQKHLLLTIQSMVTFCILVLLIIRYKLHIQLRKEQKVQSLNASLLHWNYFPYMAMEMLVCLVHPNYLTKNIVIRLFEPYDQIHVEHSLNDILALLMLMRTYIIIRTLTVSTVFSSTRASRLCRIYGCQHNYMFSIKCIMKEIPLRALAFMFLLMLLIYGQGLRISQHNLIKYMPNTFDLGNYENCFWTIIITMGTVGYGDYFPRTYPGRGIIFMASISGIIMTSLLIIVLSRYLSMDKTQTKAHIIMERLKLRGFLQKSALEAIKQSAIMGYHIHTDSGKLKDSFARLKKQSQTAKTIMRKLQTVVDTGNVDQEMNRLFEILRMSLKEIYQQQTSVRDLLHQLYCREKEQLRSIKFSFSAQIQQMIKEH